MNIHLQWRMDAFNRRNAPDRMELVSGTFDSMHDANKVYLDLCEKWHSVKLVRSPFLFGERGEYVWKVSNPIN